MGVVYEIYQHKISRTEFIPAQQNLLKYEVGRVVNVYSKTIEVAHFVATVRTRRLLTKNLQYEVR